MSAPNALNLKYDPRIKPPQWGPISAVQSAVRHNCQRLGLPVPVGYWPFWEDGGDTAWDVSPFGRHSILNGDPTWVNQGLKTDNDGEYVRLPSNFGIFDGSHSFSWLTSFSVDTFQDKNVFFTVQEENSIKLQSGETESKFLPHVRGDLNGEWQNILLGNSLSANEQYQIVVVYDLYDGWFFYQDGCQVDSNNSTGPISSGIENNAIFYERSQDPSVLGQIYPGWGVFADSLTPTQIALLYEQPYALLYPATSPVFFDMGAAGLTFDNISQSQGMDAPALSQYQGSVSTAKVTQGQTLDGLSLAQIIALTVNAISQGQTLDTLSLDQLQQLVVNEISQGQSLGSLTLDQIIPLSINGISQGQTLDEPTLILPGELVIDSIAQGQALAAPSLSQYHGILTLAKITQGQSLDPLALEQAHAIIADNISQGQQIDTPALDQLIQLSIDALTQGQTLDEPSFAIVTVLSIDGITQGQSIEATSVSQISQLIIDQINQGQIIDSLTFGIAEGKIRITITGKQPGVSINGKQPGIRFH